MGGLRNPFISNVGVGAPHVGDGTDEPMENVNTVGIVHEQVTIVTNVASGPRVGVPADTLKDDVAVVVLDGEILDVAHFVPLLGCFFYCLYNTPMSYILQ